MPKNKSALLILANTSNHCKLFEQLIGFKKMTKEERRRDCMLNFNLDSSREARSRSPINILYAAPGGPGITRSIVRVFAARCWKPKKMGGISTAHLTRYSHSPKKNNRANSRTVSGSCPVVRVQGVPQS